MWEVKNKRILVIGAAKSGLAAASVLNKKGGLVTLTDTKSIEQLENHIKPLETWGIELILGSDPEIYPGKYDFAVISPGVPLSIPLVKKLQKTKIPLTGELETAFWYTKVPIVAITGTNGKTTTTALTGQIFNDAQIESFIGGNIGIPLITGVENLIKEKVVIAETSSFQLETICTFRPKVAVIINITPDHLDRHGTMDGYTAAKARIFENQQGSDFTVLNYDDPRTQALAKQSKAHVMFFSRKTILPQGVYIDRDQVVINTGEKIINVVNCNDIYIKGGHNLENALAATAASYCLGVDPQSIGKTLKSFPGVVHRLEFVRNLKGVTYINDSKGTNPDATMKALEAYDRPIILIAGGKNKGSDFKELAQLIRAKVRVLILLGEAAQAIREAVEKTEFSSIQMVQDYPQAVSLANKVALSGDVVLLSPACASWDMFHSFEERGDLFKSLVFNLSER